MPGEGLEPSIPYGRGILSPQRIPIPPPRHGIYFLEVQMGIEPMHRGFADRSVTTSPLHPIESADRNLLLPLACPPLAERPGRVKFNNKILR